MTRAGGPISLEAKFATLEAGPISDEKFLVICSVVFLLAAIAGWVITAVRDPKRSRPPRPSHRRTAADRTRMLSARKRTARPLSGRAGATAYAIRIRQGEVIITSSNCSGGD